MNIWQYWKITILFGLVSIFVKFVFLYRLSQTFFVSALFMKLQEDYKKSYLMYVEENFSNE